MTYGNFLHYPSFKPPTNKCKAIPKNVIFNRSIRLHDLGESHLNSFYAALFKQIRLEDLHYQGKTLSMDDVISYFIPLLEMSGKHATFIPEILYLRTKTSPSVSFEYLNYLRSLPKYNRIATLFPEGPHVSTQQKKYF